MNRLRAAVLATAFLVLPGGAFAACDDQGGLVCGSGAPRVGSEPGNQVSSGGDFSPLPPGAGLKSGDRVLVGDAGATVALGPSCTRTAGPGAFVSITRSGGKTCASITEPAPAQGPVTGEVGVPRVAIGFGVAAAAGGAAALGLALTGHSNRNTGTGTSTPPIVSAQ